MTAKADNPITKPEDDLFGRARLASHFADQLLSLDVSEGVVVGVLGPWGSGKTSFINLARGYLDDLGVAVLEFNPWMFSGAEQLIEFFFNELSAQLKLRPGFAEAGRRLAEYGESFSGMAWLPLVGPWLDRLRTAAQVIARLFQGKELSIRERRARVERALADLDKPFVVAIDDIDRLTTPEIRDIFKLVRLNASFPNIIYLVAFDRARVEAALVEEGVPGRDYLEKILQIGVDLPALPAHVLNQEILQAIDDALNTVDDAGPFEPQAWPDIFIEIIRPLVRNMRDVRRYAAAIEGTVLQLEGQVALADVLALEAIRVFLPDLFAEIHRAVDGLTTTIDRGYGSQADSRLEDQINHLIEVAQGRAGVARALVHRLFPAADRHIGGSSFGSEWKSEWLRERRVAHEDVLRLYLERVAGEGFQAFLSSERAWALMDDAEALGQYLRSLEPPQIAMVIGLLETYEDQFAPEHVVPGTVVFLNLLPELPDEPRGMFDLGTELVVGRVVYRLIRSLNDAEAVKEAVEEILPRLTTLSSKFHLITTVGYREGAGHELVSEEAAEGFQCDWRAEVREARATQLAEEWDLLRILLFARRDAHPTEPPIRIDDSPELTRALLLSARSQVRSQEVGSRAMQTSSRLAWDALIELFGDEQALRERIDALRESQLSTEDDLLQLVDSYLSGQRSEDFTNG